MSSSRKQGGKKKAGGKPIMLPRAFAPHSPHSEVLLSSDQAAQIQQLADLLKRNHLTELEIECSGTRIRLRHEPTVRVPPAQTPDTVISQTIAGGVMQTAPTDPAIDTAGKVTIVSPIVGTFYRSPSPDAEPYVEEGDYVKKGQVLCIVEAMKLMNEIESESDGRIMRILVESTKPVEYGQPLFLIDPNAAP